MIFIHKDHLNRHIFLNPDTNTLEAYTPNKHFSGYAFPYRNTRMEFLCTYSEAETKRLKDSISRILNYGEQHHLFKEVYAINKKLKAIN